MVLEIGFDQITSGCNPLASSMKSTIYGSYLHRRLAINLPRETLAPGFMNRATYWKKEKNPDKRLEMAIREITVMHEHRHFRDCFGTLAGIFLFFNYMRRLRSFVEVCRKLSEQNVLWTLPMQTWALSGQCPEYVQKFALDISIDIHRQRIFEGSFGVKPLEGLDERPWERISVPGPLDFTFDAFPLSLASATSQAPTEVKHWTHWIPIGFNVLLEGIAQALQKAWLHSYYPKDVVDRFNAAQNAHMFTFPATAEVELGALGQSLVQPYNVTDYMISKYLSRNLGIPSFGRNRILEITDQALMFAKLPPFPSKRSLNPGPVFIDMMKKAVWSRPSEEPLLETSFTKDKLCDIRDSFLDCPLPEDVKDSGSVYDLLDYVERYVRHRIIAPLLKLRIDYSDKVFYDPDMYLSHGREFPLAPMVISEGLFLPATGSDPRFPAQWGKYVMLSELAESIWSGRRSIPCPRAYPERTPGLANLEFCASSMDDLGATGCDKMIAGRRCQTWDAGRKVPLPNCYFSTLVRNMRLAPL